MANKTELAAHNRRKFIYSEKAEFAIRNVLGRRGYQSASLFSHPPTAKKLFKQAILKLEKRADDIITTDERLRMIVKMDFTALHQMVNKLDKEFNEISIIAVQLQLISRLLGFDWFSGNTYRTPIYQSTRSEEIAEFYNMLDGGWRASDEELGNIGLERFNIARDLRNKGMARNQIARVLGLSNDGVRRLMAITTIDRMSELASDGKNRSEILKIIAVELGDSTKAFYDYYDLSKFGWPPIPVANKKGR